MYHAFLNYASGLRVVLKGSWATKTEPGRDNSRSSIRPLQLSHVIPGQECCRCHRGLAALNTQTCRGSGLIWFQSWLKMPLNCFTILRNRRDLVAFGTFVFVFFFKVRDRLARHQAGEASKGDSAWDRSLYFGCTVKKFL